jgi:unsaturated rhamnogalacturonyl hydrolase
VLPPTLADNDQQAPSVENVLVVETVDATAQWQLDHMDDFHSYVAKPVGRTGERLGWVRGTFFYGLACWALATDNSRHWQFLKSYGEASGWQLSERLYHADDHLMAQTYLMLYERYRQSPFVEQIIDRFNHIISHPANSSLCFSERNKARWCWCDALFMSPPAWFKLSAITGDSVYADFADKEYWKSVDFLFDTHESLFYRDSRYFSRREKSGEKIFWSRGNGWVCAGLAAIVDALPATDQRHDRYVGLFHRMAARLAVLQSKSGYWPVSLLAGASYRSPETSGTALIAAAMAWGVSRGYLPRENYGPVIYKAWNALLMAQKPNGMLGWVQQIGHAPDKVRPEETQFYGNGAFLLAGSKMLAMEMVA